MDCFQAVLGLQMGINFGSHLNGGMIEQLLGCAQIYTGTVESCCICMAQHVGIKKEVQQGGQMILPKTLIDGRGHDSAGGGGHNIFTNVWCGEKYFPQFFRYGKHPAGSAVFQFYAGVRLVAVREGDAAQYGHAGRANIIPAKASANQHKGKAHRMHGHAAR